MAQNPQSSQSFPRESWMHLQGCGPGGGWISGREVPQAALPWLPALSHHQRVPRYVGPGQGYLGAAGHRQTRTGHLAGGGKERQLLNSGKSSSELETGWGRSDGDNVPLRIPSTAAEGKCTFCLPSYTVLPWRLQVLWWPQGTWMGHFGREQRKDQRGM